MLTIIKQVKRLYFDDGRDDKSFDAEEYKLRSAIDRVNTAANEVSTVSKRLAFILGTDNRMCHF